MRRLLALVLPAALLALVFVATPSADAAAPITGRVIDYRTDAAVPNATVQLRTVNPDDTVGAVVLTTTTSSTGAFSLAAPDPADADYWVEVLADRRVQHGYVNDRDVGPSWLEWDAANADQIAPGTNLGRVNALPSYVRGTVVNAANGNKLRGITVSLRDVSSRTTVVGEAVTNRRGWFRIDGIEGEEFGVRVFGRARGFENGWLACNRTVVPTWGESCSAGPGGYGRIKLDRL